MGKQIVEMGVKILAYGLPILCAGSALLLLFFGNSSNNGLMMNAGWAFLTLALVLEMIWRFLGWSHKPMD